VCRIIPTSPSPWAGSCHSFPGSIEPLTNHQDYADPAYATLGIEAQELWRGEWGAENRYHETGLCLTADRGKEDYVSKSLENVRALEAIEIEKRRSAPQAGNTIKVLNSHEDLVCVTGTGGACGTHGYLNPYSGWADAEATMRYLRKRVAALNRVAFVTIPVERLLFSTDNTRCTGIQMEDGNFLTADLTIVAAGAWTPTLLDLRGRVTATGQVLAYIEISSEEAEALSKTPTQLNMSTGMFIIPPPSPSKPSSPASPHTKDGKFYLKVARHAYGYSNPTTISHPEDPSQGTIIVSTPHTNPNATRGAQPIPKEGLVACRQHLHAVFPPSSPYAAIADRPVAFSRLCHYADTPTGDFLLSYHPAYSRSLFVATGGNGHAFKFLPVIGEKVVDCVLGNCPEQFADKWAWREAEMGEWIGDGSRGGKKGMILAEEMMKGGNKI
jgi:sarcosine oxidase/L-pipecolate oxidase